MSRTNNNDIAEFESMLDLSTNISSSVVPRWQRKAQQQQPSGPGDRFIPSRAGMESSAFSESVDASDSDASDYAKLLKQELMPEDSNSRVLAFRKKAPAVKEEYQNTMRVLYSQQTTKKSDMVKSTRHIPSAPVRILDAPDLLDDYYLNLLSWSSNNVLAVALSQAVYLWDAGSGSIKELMSLDSDPNDYVSSVSFVQQGGSHIAVGTASNAVQLWDVQAQRQVRSLDGHSARVGALAWNGHILSSGSRGESAIINKTTFSG